MKKSKVEVKDLKAKKNAKGGAANYDGPKPYSPSSSDTDFPVVGKVGPEPSKGIKRLDSPSGITIN